MRSTRTHGRGPAKGAPPSPARNTNVEKGRPVTVNEITAHRLPLHEKCRALKGLEKIVKRPDGTRLGVPCACAHRRFLKAHPEVIIDDSGAAWWPAEDAT